MSTLAVPDSGGVKIHYQSLGGNGGQTGGEGSPTVVFLHGLVMDNLSSWFFTLANPASQITRAIVYDLRGHGMSDRPKEGYSIDRHLEDLRALLEGAGVVGADGAGRAILVGNSFGGLLAVNFARRYPELVRGLILVDAQVNDPAWKEMMLKSLTLQGEARDELIGQTFQNWLGRNSARKSNRLAQNARELIYETSLIEDLRRARDITDAELRAIRAETLAIYGESSDIIETGKRLERTIPGVDFRVFKGATHSVLWERTDEVKSLILERIRKWKESA